ncbi:MAG: SCP2 sterol-binding domain-containing protein [Actinobacteria bacterium]|nr:SCP2 sterol-binding domain-containing protein [Actinomycetota bacterium]
MANLKYLSPEWSEEARIRVKAELTPEKMHNLSSSMTNIYQNCPDGRTMYMFVEFTGGELTGFETGDGEPPRAEFKIIAEYETFAKITRAELGAVKALTSRKLTLRGNMAKALRLAPQVDKLNKVLATIPTDF